MVPLWATVVVGLGSGVVGSLINLGYQRGGELRTRMLGAADDYLQLIMEIATRLRDLRVVMTEGEDIDDATFESLGQRIQEAKDRLLLIVGRIYLLFGPSSDAAKSASRVEDRFEDLRIEFVAWANASADEKARTDAAAGALDAEVRRFTLAARNEIRSGVLARFQRPKELDAAHAVLPSVPPRARNRPISSRV